MSGRIAPSPWFRCIDAVMAAMDDLSPDVMLGEFPERSMITVERIAQNLNDSARYGIADDDGLVLQDELTAPGGPDAVLATLPIRAMVGAMRAAGISSRPEPSPSRRLSR